MANLELATFCTNAEYEERRKRRIKDSDQLNGGDIFQMLGSLDVANPEAVKFPARIEWRKRKTGLTVIRIALLGNDLNPIVATSENFVEGSGFIEGIKGAVVFRSGHPENKFRVEEAYFQDFFDGLGDFMQSQDQELSLVK